MPAGGQQLLPPAQKSPGGDLPGRKFRSMEGKRYLQAADWLASGRRFVLARIVGRVGSAPRALGAGCLVGADGTLAGTIGGGVVEYEVIRRAGTVLAAGEAALAHFELSGEDISRAGMVCGGVLDVYLEPIFPENAAATAVFAAAAELIRSGRQGVLVSRVGAGLKAMAPDNRLLQDEQGGIVGALPAAAPPLPAAVRQTRPGLTAPLEGQPVFFFDPVVPDPQLLLFGAGHISVFVAAMAKTVGFRVAVIDNRPEWADRRRFPQADAVHVNAFETAFDTLDVSPAAYIVIATRGHAFDKIVLERALKTPAAYIGMLGSGPKRDKIFAALKAEGVTEEDLDRVYAPIGLPIGAETPEEIAVSIVGELIRVRAGKP